MDNIINENTPIIVQVETLHTSMRPCQFIKSLALQLPLIEPEESQNILKHLSLNKHQSIIDQHLPFSHHFGFP